MTWLEWAAERARADAGEPYWFHAGSNRCLDLHGDPQRARLVVFSDGNHHMALEETLAAFVRAHPAVEDVFYTTTPPGPLLEWLAAGCLHLGNLRLSCVPHVFISPPPILDRVVAARRMTAHRPFMRSRGNVLLVRAGNPKGIRGIADLGRPEVRLFLSNPRTETASYQVYVETLKGLARREGCDPGLLAAATGERVVHGERIHHREAPQALADGRADVTLIYYHLALRYTRIFPRRFEIVPLGGTADDPRPEPENVISRFHAGAVDGGGPWGGQLVEFLGGAEVGAIYGRHGLSRPDQ